MSRKSFGQNNKNKKQIENYYLYDKIYDFVLIIKICIFISSKDFFIRDFIQGDSQRMYQTLTNCYEIILSTKC